MSPSSSIPNAFLLRRAHSLCGLGLSLFIIEHLLTNSQAAFDSGNGFVQAVNFIKNLPYLHFIEISFIATPVLVHLLLGIRYVLEAKFNFFATDGSSPSLSMYSGNFCFTWQRLTAYFLVFALLFHIVQMRFIYYPIEWNQGENSFFLVECQEDKKLLSLTQQLHCTLYTPHQIREQISSFSTSQTEAFQKALIQVGDNEKIAVCPSFGTAELLLVREIFKDPKMVILYSGFVLAACFHAFNGFWTFMITWGITLTSVSQNFMRKITSFLMIITALMGLIAIFGTYFSTW